MVQLNIEKPHPSWMAAIMDCEGWITIQKVKNVRGVGLCLTLGVGNTNPVLTQTLKDGFGGSVYETKRAPIQHKNYFTWRVFGNRALEILKYIEPFMILKQSQAKLAIKFQETMHDKNSYNEPCTPEYIEQMQAIKKEMGRLNRKGKDISPAETKRENTTLPLSGQE